MHVYNYHPKLNWQGSPHHQGGKGMVTGISKQQLIIIGLNVMHAYNMDMAKCMHMYCTVLG